MQGTPPAVLLAAMGAAAVRGKAGSACASIGLSFVVHCDLTHEARESDRRDPQSTQSISSVARHGRGVLGAFTSTLKGPVGLRNRQQLQLYGFTDSPPSLPLLPADRRTRTP